ncbi:Uncharacterized protein Adt_44949 [Abeliophyllum distichum]|uniref:Gamma-butyrobetaine hydroxylase-like N-terminal domain-containing protein n=1 Tax=Abeliophyllum distichum TaxID=126358 RepID=A0ABD1PEQ9_9LAMI
MFKREPTQKKPPCFPTQYAFTKAERNIPIYAFDSEGKPIYVQSEDGHMYWDVCSCQKCTKRSRSIRSPNQSSQRKLQMAYEQNSPHVGLLGEPFGKFDYFVTYTPPPSTDERIIPQDGQMMMMIIVNGTKNGIGMIPTLNLLFLLTCSIHPLQKNFHL